MACNPEYYGFTLEATDDGTEYWAAYPDGFGPTHDRVERLTYYCPEDVWYGVADHRDDDGDNYYAFEVGDHDAPEAVIAALVANRAIAPRVRPVGGAR